jgi:uncharacterized membrane protein (UPF0127 family)
MKLVRKLLLYLLLSAWPFLPGCQPKSSNDSTVADNPASAPVIEKRSDASLRADTRVSFVNSQTGAELARVSVQIADSEDERNEGLMHRSHLPDSVGMLFVFDEMGPKSFWMKNTAISLDIIFADDLKKIVKIHSFTVPYAIDSYPSDRDAQYVVEVVGGFCEKHGIREGDRLTFTFPKP